MLRFIDLSACVKWYLAFEMRVPQILPRGCPKIRSTKVPRLPPALSVLSLGLSALSLRLSVCLCLVCQLLLWSMINPVSGLAAQRFKWLYILQLDGYRNHRYEYLSDLKASSQCECFAENKCWDLIATAKLLSGRARCESWVCHTHTHTHTKTHSKSFDSEFVLTV